MNKGEKEIFPYDEYRISIMGSPILVYSLNPFKRVSVFKPTLTAQYAT